MKTETCPMSMEQYLELKLGEGGNIVILVAQENGITMKHNCSNDVAVDVIRTFHSAVSYED